MTTALAISGGGSKGAFAVGVIEYLVNTAHLDFDVYAGTSTGAMIVPLLAAGVPGAIDTLHHLYTTVRKQDIVVERQPALALNDYGWFETTPAWNNLITKYVTPDVFNRLQTGKKIALFVTQNLPSGRTVYWQIGGTTGPIRVTDAEFAEVRVIPDLDTLRRAILASGSMPVIMRSIEVPYQAGMNALYCDGGVRQYAPIQIALDAGADHVYAVVLSPPWQNRAPCQDDLSNLINLLQRSIDLLTGQVGDGNIQLAGLYTRAAQYADAVVGALRDRLVGQGGVSADVFDAALASVQAQSPFTGPTARLTVIRPDSELVDSQGKAVDTLTFDGPTMESWLQRGAQIASKTPLDPDAGVRVPTQPVA